MGEVVKPLIQDRTLSFRYCAADLSASDYRDSGLVPRADGDDLVLEASAQPPSAVLDLLSRHKADIMTLLRSPAPGPPRTPEPIPPPQSRTEQGTQDWGRGDAAQTALVAGLHVATRGRLPSWAGAAPLPSRGCFVHVAKASDGGASARHPKAGAARPAIRPTTYPRMP